MQGYKNYDSHFGNSDQATDLYNMVIASGRYIGHVIKEDETTRMYYVLDGYVYECTATMSVFFREDYFEFCNKIRNGEIRGFEGAIRFHLG